MAKKNKETPVEASTPAVASSPSVAFSGSGEFNCLYGKLRIQVPGTIEEFDQSAGANGAALATAVKFVIYHKTLGNAREAIADEVEKRFAFKRLEIDTGNKAKDGTAIMRDEDPDDLVKRLFASKGWSKEAPPAEWLGLVAGISVTFDPKATVRSGKAKVLPKSYLEAAQRIITNGNQAKWAGEFGLTLTGNTEEDAKLLGWAIKGREDAKRAEEEARKKALYQ